MYMVLPESKKIENHIQKEIDKTQYYYNEFKDKFEGKDFFIIKEGELNEVILSESMTADLVIMGNVPPKKRGGRIHDSTYHLIQRTNSPLLSICEGNECLGNNFLLAYDGSRSANNAMKIMGDFKIERANVTVLTVTDREEKAYPLLNEEKSILTL